MDCYVHHVPGRMRIKIPAIKGRPDKANAIDRLFSALFGIYGIRINSVTGSVVVHYDPDCFDMKRIMNILKYHGYVDPSRPVPVRKPISNRATKAGMTLSKAFFSWAVSRALESSGLGFLAVFI